MALDIALTGRYLRRHPHVMLRAYFDSNLYDAIEKGCVPAEEVEALRLALARREVIAQLSFQNIEELLGHWKEGDRPAAIRRLRIALNLVGFDDFLKDSADMLGDAVAAYATGASPPTVMLPRTDRRAFTSFLRKVARRSTSINSDVLAIVARGMEERERFHAGIMRACEKARKLGWESRAPDERTFEAFWAASAPLLAEWVAGAFGLADACRTRGFDGLLGVGAVRLGVLVPISQTFSQVVGEDNQGNLREPKRSDKYDIRHAIVASTADVFLTMDARLAKQVTRIPVEGFRVVTSVQDLLSLLPAEKSPLKPR